MILFKVSFLESDFFFFSVQSKPVTFLFPSVLWLGENKQKKTLWIIGWMVGWCLWIPARWAAGEDGGDCKVKRGELGNAEWGSNKVTFIKG